MIRLLLVECPAAADLRRFARVVDALTAVCPWIDPVRPGVCTLPIRGPLRYWGDEAAVLDRVAAAVQEPAALGVAEGVFAAALAARAGVVVPEGETARFLAPWPVGELGDPHLAELLARLGLVTLGDFAAVPTADVLARFGAAGAHRHRVARALEGELAGVREPGLGARLATVLGRELAPVEHQPGFWGGASAADERAAEVLTALQRRLGPEAVTVPVLDGGRGPAERAVLVPWAAASPPPRPVAELPWPGRLPPPAPARVARVPAALVDGAGAPLGVTGRGMLTGRPARLSIDGGPWAALAGWSAPWPVEEWRARRRAARLQVATVAGAAYLLVLEGGRWWTEGVYD